MYKLSQVRTLVGEIGLHPSKALGQNFLVDQNILDILMQAAALDTGDAVLEPGPGLGVLTDRLLAACARVTAVEKDAKLVAYLRTRYAGHARLELIEADMLDLDLAAVTAVPTEGTPRMARMVSNLPYAAGTRMLMDWVLLDPAPLSATVTLQREVGLRLVADPGTHDYGMASVWVRLQYDVRVIKTVPATCFWPRPEVVSCIVDLRVKSGEPLDGPTRERVCRLTRRAFQQRRKQVAVALSGPDGLDRAVVAEALRHVGAREKDRAENLDPDQWIALARVLGE